MNKNELYDRLEEMKELMGIENLLNEIVNGMSSNELFDALEYIDRMHDLNLFDEKEENES